MRRQSLFTEKQKTKHRIYIYEEVACRILSKHWPLTTVKRLQWKIDVTGTVNRNVNLAVEENKKLFEEKYSIISVICC